MQARAAVLVLTLGVLVAPGASAQGPRFAGAFALPGVLCDCDPADFVFRTTRALPGHAAPDPASPVVRTVAAGRLIEANDWSEALTVVVTPAAAEARRDTTLRDLQRYGDVRFVGHDETGTAVPALAVRRGDRLDYLTAVEGYAYFRHDGVVYGGGYPFYESTFRMDRIEPEQAVWFRLTPKPDRPAAWVRLDLFSGAARPNVEMLCETHGGCVPGFRR